MTTQTPDTETPQLFPDVDAALDDLAEGEKTWAALPLARRRALLERIRALSSQHATEWVDAATGVKKLDPSSPLVGEEWLSGPYSMITAATLLAESIEKLEAGQSPLAKAKFGTAPGGRTTVKVLPMTTWDSLLLSGYTAEVWLEPGVTEAQARATAGLGQKDPTATGGIGVVLGAGNITSIAPLDALYELFAFNRVVALKLNPIMDPMLPVLRKVLAPLVEIGAVRILTGGADVGTYLVHHAQVAHVHMTGSSLTHDAIVFGTGDDGARRKASGEALLDKPISSELGGVSPTIVLPGKWTKADIAFQAEHVATQRLHNGGYNCVASQVVVVSAEWPQKDEFLTALRAALDNAPAREPYYPGSDTRVASATTTFPNAERRGPNGGRVLVTDLDPGSYAPLLQTEYFSPVIGVIELPYNGKEFARRAVATANEDFIGTLGVNIVAHPDTLADLGSELETLIESLKYGTVAVNAWTALGFLTAGAPWGAFPGHTLDDVQSGIGVVHNAYLIERPERTVARGPFRPAPRSILNREMALTPKPPWFVTNKTAATTGRLMTVFAGKPSWAKLPALFASALRG
ncbi:aldehyde dehydrogenase family protein [Actinomycetes bacterium M1A6_2h]